MKRVPRKRTCGRATKASWACSGSGRWCCYCANKSCPVWGKGRWAPLPATLPTEVVCTRTCLASTQTLRRHTRAIWRIESSKAPGQVFSVAKTLARKSASCPTFAANSLRLAWTFLLSQSNKPWQQCPPPLRSSWLRLPKICLQPAAYCCLQPSILRCRKRCLGILILQQSVHVVKWDRWLLSMSNVVVTTVNEFLFTYSRYCDGDRNK